MPGPIPGRDLVAASSNGAIAWQARAYRAVLTAYPYDFREEYAREMCLSFVDDCRAQDSWLGLAGVWSRALSDVALDAPKERVRMWWQDVRYGLRMLWKDRLTTMTALIVLALGIGATTTVFTLVNGVLLRPLPYPDADRLIAIDELRDGNSYLGMNAPMAMDLRAQARTIVDLSLYEPTEPTVRDHVGADRIPAAYVNDGLWRILGVSPMLGRGFTRAEDTDKHPLTVVLSHELWQRRYGGAQDILSRTVSVGGEPATVVGIMPPGFHFPHNAQMWLPTRTEESRDNRTSYSAEVVARLAPGVSMAQAQAELATLVRQVVKAHPESEQGQTAAVRPLHVVMAGDYRRQAPLLFGAVSLVLLIACANVANLLLAKAAARGREMALRGALGAPRRRLVRQLLVESLLLGLIGAAAGVAIALVALPAMLALIPETLPAWVRFTPDFRVIAFVSAIAILTGLCVGTLPALSASRGNPVTLLNEGGRGRSASGRQRTIQNALVVAEVALSMLLLVSAGLMARSFLHVSQRPLGWDPSQVVAVRTSIPPPYDDEGRILGLVRRQRDELAALPGVTKVAATAGLPLANLWGRSVTAEGHPVLGVKDAPMINHWVVTPGYFETIGIALIEGRDFTETDGKDQAQLVTVVDEALARRYWPGQSAIGKRVRYGPPESNEPWHTVIGVTARIATQQAGETGRWDIYIPHRERIIASMRYVLRTNVDPGLVLPLVRPRLVSIDRGIAVTELQRLQRVVSDSMWRPRFFTVLILVFAAVALTLALVGLYGMVSYGVQQRRFELGVRAALGARASGLRWMITAQSVRLVLIGIAIGGAASLALRQVLATQLFEVSATDPWMLAGTAIALTTIAAAASYWPVRNATRVDPVRVLRE